MLSPYDKWKLATPYRYCPYCENDYRGHACPCGQKPEPPDGDEAYERWKDDKLTEGR